MKKSAFTIAESLVSLLIISMAVMASFNFISAYKKVTFERDVSINALMKNITAAESLRAGDDTFSRLYELSLNNEIKVTAVGIGDISLNSDGTFNVIGEDSYNLPDNLKPDEVRLLKVEIGGGNPNARIITAVRVS